MSGFLRPPRSSPSFTPPLGWRRAWMLRSGSANREISGLRNRFAFDPLGVRFRVSAGWVADLHARYATSFAQRPSGRAWMLSLRKSPESRPSQVRERCRRGSIVPSAAYPAGSEAWHDRPDAPAALRSGVHRGRAVRPVPLLYGLAARAGSLTRPALRLSPYPRSAVRRGGKSVTVADATVSA